jgi:hypothetical protein
MVKLALAASTAAAALFCLMTAPAHGATFLNEAPPATDGSLSWDFGDTGGIAAGLFTEDFTLTLPADGFTAAGVEATFTSKSNDLTFSLVTLGGLPFTLFDEPSEHLGNFPAHTFAGGPVLLEVKGISPGPDGSYDGHVTFTPVPEPAVWALMIFGFGGIGAMLRWRRLAETASPA